MKKVTFILIAWMAAVMAWADDYPYLTLQTTDGQTTSVSVTSLVLTFSGGQLVATNSEGTQSFTLTELSKMYFSTGNETAIEASEVSTEAGDDAEVYDLQGHRMTSALRKGVYIVKSNGQTRKIVVK